MLGLLIVNVHLGTMVKSNQWIPEVWRFMGKCLSSFDGVDVKKYRQKEWGIVLVLDKVAHTDLIYVFSKILATIFANKNLSVLS